MTPWVRTLVLSNVVMFLVSQMSVDVYRTLLLVPGLVGIRPWTPVTYMFLHGGVFHLLFNMLSLYFFGSRVEDRLGGRRFLVLYLVSGLMGAALSFLFTPRAAIVGASGAIFGVTYAYARYWPDDPVMMLGLPPIPARVMVILMAVLALAGGAGMGSSGIAHFAHLGGFAGGWLYLAWSDRRTPAAQFKARAATAVRSGTSADLERWKKLRGDGLHPVNRAELERLQEQIAMGMAGTLTPDEKAFLDRLSASQGDLLH